MASESKSRRKLPYRPHYTGDFRGGTRALSLAEVGLYGLIIDLLWEMGGSMPSDPLEVARLLGKRNPKSIRAPLANLIAVGKLHDVDGTLTNLRVIRDLRQTVSEKIDDQSAINSQSIPDQFAINSESCDGKSNDFKVLSPLREITQSLISDSKKENKTIPASNLAVAASPAPADPGGLAGLNGATTEILETVARWVNPLMPDRRTATGFVTKLVQLHGSEAVKAGYGRLAAKLASGDIVARPLVLLDTLVTAAARQPTAAGRPAERRETNRERGNRLLAAKLAVDAAANQGVH